MFEGVIVSVTGTHSATAQKIANYAGQTGDIMNIMTPVKFSSGECCPRFNISIKDKKVYLIATQSPFLNPQDVTTRIALAANAAKENGASKVTAIMTDLSFSRQDRGPKEDSKMSGQPHSAKVQAKIFAACGVDCIVTAHLHSKRLYDIYQEVYQKPGKEVLYEISPDIFIADYLLNKSSLKIVNGGENLLGVAVDQGSIPFLSQAMELMNIPNAGILVFDKKRKVPNKEDAVSIETKFAANDNSIKGKKILVIDDMIDTGGTLLTICDFLIARKPEEIYLYFTHAVFAGKAYMEKQRALLKTFAKEIICTNTRPYIAEELEKLDYEFKKKLTVILMEKIFAEVIIQCCEQNKHPDEIYNYTNAKELYEIKRSEIHFLEKKEREQN